MLEESLLHSFHVKRVDQMPYVEWTKSSKRDQAFDRIIWEKHLKSFDTTGLNLGPTGPMT